jgi:flagellar motor switch/type III secretory pathway protein FliN
MSVGPFDLSSLSSLSSRPRVCAQAARASRAALPVVAGVPDGWRGELPPLGEATVTLGGVHAIGAARASFDPVFAVWRGATLGRLSVDAAFASRIVDTVLGGRDAVRVARALGPAERGVLAGALGGVLGNVGWSLGLGPAAAFDVAAVALVFEVETTVGIGRVEVQWPTSVRGGTSAALAERLARLPITAPVVIAETRLRASEVAGVSPGDAVVFDGVHAAAFAGDVNWPARLALGVGGRRYWSVTVDHSGGVTIAGKLDAPRDAGREEEPMNGPGNTIDADMTAALAAAPIEVVAELGRITLRGEELAGLAPGAVLTLGAGRAGIILNVGGERWAEGEIVDVDGELGIRITRVLGR